MSVREHDEVDGGRIDTGGLKTGREMARRGLRSDAESGVDQHAPIARVHKNDIHLGAAGTEMVRLHELLQLGLREVGSEQRAGNVKEPSLSTVT